MNCGVFLLSWRSTLSVT